ncbi:Fur family transcriptional regulator [Pseudomonas putida]|uniref:Fur family transcriptional regulator n=1 Tax=Pseudomonas putida TaxID=303 RepID=UPI00274C25ED|nr:Fur family transcriptional regulator [Pseudomonas putida]MDP9524300.1 Fur family transcriptional regulator [Pseudomonas putida]
MQLTTNQQRVLATLQQSSRPLSAYKILERLKSEGFKAPTQIYRALGFLAQRGLVHRLESLNAYVRCAPPSTEQGVRAFAICDSCGHVDEFIVPSLNRYLGTWMKQNVFSLGSSTIELHGKCATCSKLDRTSDS